MKKLITSLTILLTVSIIFAGGVFAAMNWNGSQDAQEINRLLGDVVDANK